MKKNLLDVCRFCSVVGTASLALAATGCNIPTDISTSASAPVSPSSANSSAPESPSVGMRVFNSISFSFQYPSSWSVRPLPQDLSTIHPIGEIQRPSGGIFEVDRVDANLAQEQQILDDVAGSNLISSTPFTLGMLTGKKVVTATDTGTGSTGTFTDYLSSSNGNVFDIKTLVIDGQSTGDTNADIQTILSSWHWN
jgi:hypothetical protein